MNTRTSAFVIGLLGVGLTVMVSATEPVIYDQNNLALIGVPELVPMDELLEAYGATADEADPELPLFLEGVLDLVSTDIRNGAYITVLDTGVKSTYDENETLVEQGLDCAVFVGAAEAEISLLSLPGGELRLHVTICENGSPPEYHDATLRIYVPQSIELARIPVIALPGTCKCSDNTTTGCTKTMCEDGETCPGVNGHSCGYYTSSFD